MDPRKPVRRRRFLYKLLALLAFTLSYATFKIHGKVTRRLDSISKDGFLGFSPLTQARVHEAGNRSTELARNVTLNDQGSQSQNRTLVLLLGSIRGGEETWNSMYSHFLDLNHADVALMVSDPNGTAAASSSLLSRAKYKWFVPDYEDWGDALTEALNVSQRWRDIHLPTRRNSFGGTRGGPNSSGLILPTLKVMAWQHIQALDLLSVYENFVITRPDMFFLCDLSIPTADNTQKVYVPGGMDFFGGLNDRYMQCHSSVVEDCLTYIDDVFRNPTRWLKASRGNTEILLRSTLEKKGVLKGLVRFHSPMFICKSAHDPTRSSYTGKRMDTPCELVKYVKEFKDARSVCKEDKSGTEIIIEPPPPPKEVTNCGCPTTCTPVILDRNIGEFSCRQRINYLMNTYQTSEQSACSKVAGDEYPVFCGPDCDPNKCNNFSSDDEDA